MACDTCKKRNNFKEKVTESTDMISKAAVIISIITFGFAIYGVYSLIIKFI